MINKPRRTPHKRGRRTKAEELQRAIVEFGIDPDLIDPRRVLASIAADIGAPATARVAASKALLILGGASVAPPLKKGAAPQRNQAAEDEPNEDAAGVVDLATRRALEIMRRRTQ